MYTVYSIQYPISTPYPISIPDLSNTWQLPHHSPRSCAFISWISWRIPISWASVRSWKLRANIWQKAGIMVYLKVRLISWGIHEKLALYTVYCIQFHAEMLQEINEKILRCILILIPLRQNRQRRKNPLRLVGLFPTMKGIQISCASRSYVDAILKWQPRKTSTHPFQAHLIFLHLRL